MGRGKAALTPFSFLLEEMKKWRIAMDRNRFLAGIPPKKLAVAWRHLHDRISI